MDNAAEDDAERARNRARLYAPPGGKRRRRSEDGQRAVPGPGAMRMGDARALMAQMAAQDAQMTRGGTG
ncbi:hypothetical protein PV410_34065 [Streptomyces sp. PA03-5A]|nr:hypothetical protein [Streptomyces sp. PA03-5A]